MSSNHTARVSSRSQVGRIPSAQRPAWLAVATLRVASECHPSSAVPRYFAERLPYARTLHTAAFAATIAALRVL